MEIFVADGISMAWNGLKTDIKPIREVNANP